MFQEARNLLTEVIEHICNNNGWTPYAVEVMPDHIHLFLGTKDFRVEVLGKLKGESASFLKYCFPVFSKALTDERLWSRSYYISSIGNISGKTLMKYLAKQWKEFGDPRYELTLAALYRGQKRLECF